MTGAMIIVIRRGPPFVFDLLIVMYLWPIFFMIYLFIYFMIYFIKTNLFNQIKKKKIKKRNNGKILA